VNELRRVLAQEVGLLKARRRRLFKREGLDGIQADRWSLSRRLLEDEVHPTMSELEAKARRASIDNLAHLAISGSLGGLLRNLGGVHEIGSQSVAKSERKLPTQHSESVANVMERYRQPPRTDQVAIWRPDEKLSRYSEASYSGARRGMAAAKKRLFPALEGKNHETPLAPSVRLFLHEKGSAAAASILAQGEHTYCSFCGEYSNAYPRTKTIYKDEEVWEEDHRQGNLNEGIVEAAILAANREAYAYAANEETLGESDNESVPVDDDGVISVDQLNSATAVSSPTSSKSSFPKVDLRAQSKLPVALRIANSLAISNARHRVSSEHYPRVKVTRKRAVSVSVPMTEYDQTDIKYYYEDPHFQKIYTLTYNTNSQRYIITDIARRKVILESSVDPWKEGQISKELGVFSRNLLDEQTLLSLSETELMEELAQLPGAEQVRILNERKELERQRRRKSKEQIEWEEAGRAPMVLDQEFGDEQDTMENGMPRVSEKHKKIIWGLHERRRLEAEEARKKAFPERHSAERSELELRADEVVVAAKKRKLSPSAYTGPNHYSAAKAKQKSSESTRDRKVEHLKKIVPAILNRPHTLSWNFVDEKLQRQLDLGLEAEDNGLKKIESPDGSTIVVRETSSQESISRKSATDVGNIEVLARTVTEFIHECPSAFCDLPGLMCRMQTSETAFAHKQCCNLVNYDSLCFSPPCWFPAACPVGYGDLQNYGAEGSAATTSVQRRLSTASKSARAVPSPSVMGINRNYVHPSFVANKGNESGSEQANSVGATAAVFVSNAFGTLSSAVGMAAKMPMSGPISPSVGMFEMNAAVNVLDDFFDSLEDFDGAKQSSRSGRSSRQSSATLHRKISPRSWTWLDNWMADQGYIPDGFGRGSGVNNALVGPNGEYRSGSGRWTVAVLTNAKSVSAPQRELFANNGTARSIQYVDDDTLTWAQELYHQTDGRRRLAASSALHERGDLSRIAITQAASRRELQDAAVFGGAYKINRMQTDGQRIYQMEMDEQPLLMQSWKTMNAKLQQDDNKKFEDAKVEIQNSILPAAIRDRERQKQYDRDAFLEQQQQELYQNTSRVLTRVNVLRDSMVKVMIRGLSANQQPKRFDTPVFTIYIGKTTNLSAVHPSFVFPAKFIVPPDSPDEPTLLNPVTGFAFEYLEYKDNMYKWSDSSPPSDESMIITLLVFHANAVEYPIRNEPEPILVFADISVFSSGLCMFWDRLAKNTAGGKWVTEGIINDATGCLTTRLGDIGIFLDGRAANIGMMVDPDVFSLSTTVDKPNIFTIAMLMLVLLLNWFLILYGYKSDEKMRSDENAGIIPVISYHYDGDGITTPMNANDPVAYKYADVKNSLFLLTFWNVIKREHIIVSPIFYHRTFSRPQRLLCAMALLTGILSINAAVYGSPGEVVGGIVPSGRQYIVSGILSALLIYPVFVFLCFMFTGRPIAIKKRMVKKRHADKELEMIRKERQKLEAQSGMIPASTGMMGVGGMRLPVGPGQKSGEGMALLALPPAGAGAAVMGGGPQPGQLALPVGPPSDGMMRPPAPKYPPPGVAYGGQQFTRAPPPPQDMLPPIAFQGGFANVGQQALPNYDMGAGMSNFSTPRGGTPMSASGAQLALGGMKALTPRRGGPPQRPGASAMQGGPPSGRGGAPMAPDAVGMAGGPPPGQRLPVGFPNAEGQHNSAALSGSSSSDSEIDAEERTDVKQKAFAKGSHRMQPPPPRPPPIPTRSFPPSGGNSGQSSARGGRGPPPAMRGAPPPPMDASGSAFRSTTGFRSMGQNFGSFAEGPPSGARTPQMPPPMPQPVPRQMPSPMTPRGMGMPMTPSGLPPVVPFGIQGDNIIQRGLPPSFFPAPFRGGAKAPGVPENPYALALVGQGAGPGAFPPTPGRSMGGRSGMVSPAAGVPLPPPPPREDDSAFVRRVRLIYMDRVMREHQKQDLQEIEEYPRDIPNWVYNMSAVMPYVACATFVVFSSLMCVVYSVQFDSWQETHWYYSCIVGLVLVIFLLDVVKAGVITVVELRRFEIRKRVRAGDFIVRKVQKTSDGTAIGGTKAKAKSSTKAKATPPIPRSAPKYLQEAQPRQSRPPLPQIPRGNSGIVTPGDRPSPRSIGGPPARPPGSRTPPGGFSRTGSRTPPVPYSGQVTPSGRPGRPPPVSVPFGQSRGPQMTGSKSPVGSERSFRGGMSGTAFGASGSMPTGNMPAPPPMPPGAG
jgi:uncharacterized membrane protein YagU involved in acid resistance